MRSLLIVLPLLLFGHLAGAADLSHEMPGAAELRKRNVRAVTVCGSPEITLSSRSLKQHFLIGVPPVGYVFSDLIEFSEYERILKEFNLKEASAQIREKFGRATLWEITPAGEVRNLGHPIEIETRFTASVKDCREGARTTLGADCSAYNSGVGRDSCCFEKFIGPLARWRDGKETISLTYSPDPSIRLRFSKNKSVRYCSAIDRLRLTANGN